MSVRKVSTERWREAQQWELATWESGQRRRGWRKLAWSFLKPLLVALRSERVHGDDWNHWWAHQFEGYEWLPRQIDDFIELGCGPYTNTRLIVRNRMVRRIVCSDPLIRSYIRFKGRWLAEVFRRGLVLIDDHPMEECPSRPGRLMWLS